MFRWKPSIRLRSTERGMAMGYVFELHFHTSEVSACGNVSAADGVRAYAEKGYAGLVVTDHFYRGYFDSLPDTLSWPEKVDRFLAGYRTAEREGKACGIRVLPGMELRFDGSANDYLVYGMTEELLRETVAPYEWTEGRFSAFAREHGLLFAQAHPFRPGLTRCAPALLDGVEIYNGNRRHNSHNDLAAAFAEENGLLPLAGSDFHEWEDLQYAGAEFERLPLDAADLVKLLRSRAYRLCTGTSPAQSR